MSFRRLPRSELLAHLGFGVVAAGDVPGDRLLDAPGGIAEAAAARRRHAHDVADTDDDVLILRQMRWAIGLAVPAHLDRVGAAIAAAQNALRAGAAVVHHHRNARLATT